MTWAQQMVDEGIMYWADSNSTATIAATRAAFQLKKIACGFLEATQNDYEDGRNHFCQLVYSQARVTLLGGEYIMQDGLCQGAEDCTMVLNVAFGVAGGLARDALPSVCEPIFDELWRSCNGNVGGIGELSVMDSWGNADWDGVCAVL
ncbi:hypothetical protein BJX99DRAFT_217534 [Aspergillus californicus]